MVCLMWGTVYSFIDWWLILSYSWPARQTSALSESVKFELPPPTATKSILHTHKLSASQLKNATDRPRSTLPDQICNLSAGKHAGGLKVEEPSIWSRYSSHCSVCSTWAHFTLQRAGGLYGPFCKRPEALPPRVPPPRLRSSPEGEIRLTGQQDRGLRCS